MCQVMSQSVASSARNEYYMGLHFLCLLDKFNSPYLSRIVRCWSKIVFIIQSCSLTLGSFLELLFFVLCLQIIHPLELVVNAGDRPVICL
uniref:Uncharacterized protein n=1 Tax=Arundo donax TaxID=35708 RepID=A0A0A9A840_ARUDO